jgi:uncharacterized membrane protein
MVDVVVPHWRYMMTLGPLHLIVIGFRGHDDDFKGKVPRAFRAAHALRAAHRHGDVRVLDMLLIRKDASGSIHQLQVSELGEQERAFAGCLAGGVLGLSSESPLRAKPAATYGVLAVAEHEFGLSEAELRECTRDIPMGGAAAIVLVEQLWVVRLKDAIDDAGCRLIAEGMLTSETLSALGADVAIAQHAADHIYAH